MKVTPIRLPEPLIAALRRLARAQHRTLSSYIRSVLRRDVEEKAKAA